MEALGSDVKRIVLSGYYGFNNSGDEAVLQSILLSLQEAAKELPFSIEPIVLSADPELTSRMYGVKAAPRMKPGALFSTLRACDGLISGGGSLLQDSTGVATIPYYLGIVKMAQMLGKPTFIYSQGIGPVNRRIFDPFIRNVFNKARYVSVRDDESAELLRRMKVNAPVEVVPDPVMGLPLPAGGQADSAPRECPVIGVSVRHWNKDRSELDALAQALYQAAATRQLAFRFLPFHLPSDKVASEYVMERMRSIAALNNTELELAVADGTAHPQAMLAEVSACDLVVGMRLHSLIYAASQFVPMLGISYDPKIDQFLRRLNMQPAATTGDFNPEAFAAVLLALLADRENWVADKSTLIAELKGQAQQPARQIANYYKKVTDR